MTNLNNKKKVSVIIPLYNKAAYIKRAIESVIHQEYKDIEIIVVDDGSTDNSVEKILYYKDIIKLCKQPHLGPSKARNKGVELSSGEFVTFLDADDEYYPSKINREIKCLLTNKHVDWVVSPHYHVRPNGSTYLRYIKNQNGYPFVGEIANDTLNQLEIRGTASSCFMLKRKAFFEIGGFNDNLHCFEITEFLVRLALARPIVAINRSPVVKIYDIEGSTFKNMEKKRESLEKLVIIWQNLWKSSENPYIEMLAKNAILDLAWIYLNRADYERAFKLLTKQYHLKKNWKWLNMTIRSLYGMLTQCAEHEQQSLSSYD